MALKELLVLSHVIVSLGATPFDTTGATQSPELWPCAAGDGPDLWYTYTAASTGRATLRLYF